MSDPFLIDECLSPSLVAAAIVRGHEATHVLHRALQGKSDVELMSVIETRGFVFVTNNERDFLKLYARASIHPGLIIIVPGNLSATRQIDLFGIALDTIEAHGDLVNTVLRVLADGSVELVRRP